MSRDRAARRGAAQGQRGNRLKAVNLDPLEAIGFPSKGDDRLLEFGTQEDYYSKVVQRYDDFWAGSGRSLNDAFASLSLDGANLNGYPHVKSGTSNGSNSGSKELSTILMAMRKIREAVVSSARKDAFALRAYVFIIRATILAKHMESYHPALLHLLHSIHPVTHLTTVEHNEFVGYYILDLACRQNDLAAAYRVKSQYKYKDDQVEAVVKALVHGDWFTYWNIEYRVTSYQKRLMEWTKDEVRSRALGCLGKSYLSVDKKYLEKAIHWPWEELVKKKNIGWQLQGDVVIIRRIKDFWYRRLITSKKPLIDESATSIPFRQPDYYGTTLTRKSDAFNLTEDLDWARNEANIMAEENIQFQSAAD